MSSVVLQRFRKVIEKAAYPACVPRYSEVLVEQLERPGDARDYVMHTSCTTCGPMTLGECDFHEGSPRSTYRCALCGATLAFVDENDGSLIDIPDAGFRVGPWVLRTRTDLLFQPRPGGGWVKIPATPAFFD